MINLLALDPFTFWYLGFCSFLLGTCMGSFLNVCIYRIPREESVVKPRSHCPHCGKLIPWYLNIPVFSYLALRARCRFCGGRISPRYFLVEMLTGTLFLLVWLHYGLDVRTPVYWLIIFGLILGTFVDFEHMIIPDRVSLGGIVLGLVLSPLIPSLHGETNWLRALMWAGVGLAAGSGILWIVGVIGKLIFRKEAMGMGDVKLLGALGAFLGWQAVLFIVMVSSLIGSIVGIGLIVSRKQEWQSRIPYGPYISMAAVIWILWGAGWWNIYVAWLSGAKM
jgi:leader peptidase (prepilin peptidase) / N-methyltransferase